VKKALTYILLRLAAFGVPLVALIMLGADKYISVAIAAAIGLTISIVWLSPTREELSRKLYEKYNTKTASETAEDNDN
jgi:hypothetical protein